MTSSTPDWNARWRERADKPFTVDPWLLSIAPLLPRTGLALDLACGRGRHALFLAERGLSVTALDSSAEALTQLGTEATLRDLHIETRRVDLEVAPQLQPAAFDLVLLLFYLQRSLMPHLRAAVRPGGLAVVRTFSSAGPFPGGPDNPDFVLRPGELLQIFAGWEILRHEEGLEPSSKGGSVAGIVARRPLVPRHP
jgi:SAM-dependent methyltransferase